MEKYVYSSLHGYQTRQCASFGVGCSFLDGFAVQKELECTHIQLSWLKQINAEEKPLRQDDSNN